MSIEDLLLFLHEIYLQLTQIKLSFVVHETSSFFSIMIQTIYSFDFDRSRYEIEKVRRWYIKDSKNRVFLSHDEDFQRCETNDSKHLIA